jgi:P27 family predicted phage terminase small subunit
MLKVPRSLSPKARAHWKRLAAVLQPLGLLSPADRDAFITLTENLAIIDTARAELAKSGLVVLVRGKPASNPYLVVLRNAENQAVRLFTEFGLTPSSRTRVFSALVQPAPSLNNQDDLANSYFEDEPEAIVQ